MRSLFIILAAAYFLSFGKELEAAGAGVAIYSPTGFALTAKQKIFGGNAVEGGIGLLTGTEFLAQMIQGHYIIQRKSRVYYYGLGLRIASFQFDKSSGSSDYTAISVRAPVGIHSRMNRIEFFGEAGVLANFTSDNLFGFDFSVGARYQF